VERWYAPFALVNGAALGLTPILLPLVVEHRGAGQVGLVMGAYNLGALAAPAAGAVVDRWPVQRLLAVVGAAGSAMSLWLFPHTGPGLQLLLGLLDGASFAVMVTVANLLIVERRPQAEWNPRLGWLETVLSLGQAAALLLAGLLSSMSYTDALGFAAIVPAAAIPLSLVLIPRAERRPRGERPGDETARRRSLHRLEDMGRSGEWGAGGPSRHHYRVSPRELLKHLSVLRGGFGLLLAAWVPAYAGATIVFSLYPVLFQHAFGVQPGVSSLAFSLIVFASLPLYSIAGTIGQRTGPRTAMTTGLVIRLVVLVALAVLASVHGVPAAVPLIAFSGVVLGWAFLSVASPGLTAQLVPQAEGPAQGVLSASSGLAGLLGSVAGGAIAGAFGYSVALVVAAAAVGFGLALFMFSASRSAGSRPAGSRPEGE
jgi:MFS family permease